MLGTENPIAEICRLAHDAGALVLVDGAQSAPKMALDMAALGADFYAITGHKLYAPTGIGVLWTRLELLRAMPPFLGGGSMIRKVGREGTTYAEPPARFEAGTPAIAQAIGMASALRWLDSIGMDAVRAHELAIADYALERLAQVPGLKVFGPPRGPDRLGPVSFEIDGIHAHDVSEILDRHGVAVRAGHHCAQILMDRLGVAATARASFGVYTTPGRDRPPRRRPRRRPARLRPLVGQSVKRSDDRDPARFRRLALAAVGHLHVVGARGGNGVADLGPPATLGIALGPPQQLVRAAPDLVELDRPPLLAGAPGRLQLAVERGQFEADDHVRPVAIRGGGAAAKRGHGQEGDYEHGGNGTASQTQNDLPVKRLPDHSTISVVPFVAYAGKRHHGALR